MNANTFLSNISTSLRLLETKIGLIEKAVSTTSENINEIKKIFQKNITELTTLIQ